MGESTNCPICILKPNLFWARLNMLTVYTTCPHSKRRSFPHFYKSTVLSNFAFLTVTFLSIRSYVSVANFNKIEFNETVVSTVTIILGITISIIIINMQLNLSKMIQHCNNLLQLFARKTLYEIDEFIDDQYRQKMRLIVDGSYPSYLGQCLLLIGKTLYQYQTLNLEKVCYCLTILILLLTFLSIIVTFLTMLESYFSIFQKCHHQTRKFLIEQSAGKLLKVRLRKIQKLHMVASANFQIIQDTFDFPMLLFWLCASIIMIGNFFGFLNYLFYHEELSENAIVTLVISLFAALSTIHLVFKLDKLGHVVRKNVFRDWLNYTSVIFIYFVE